jgi:hypothetical protein
MSKATNKPEIILHVGMHKTGTTFLQWNVFHFVDANYLWHVFYKSWLKDLLNLDKKVNYDKIKNKLPSILKNDKINILSEENIYTYQFTKKDDRFVLLDRIKKVFPEAKIIFGTRKKEENLVSWYVEYVAVGGILDFQGFLDKHMNQKKLDYEPYINKLNEYYGKENVFVYTLDELRKDQDALIKKICKFMGVKEPEKYRKKPARVGYGPTALKLSLFMNRFFKTPVNKKGLIPCWGPVLPQNIVFHSSIVKLFPKKKITLEYLKKMKIE